MNITKLNQSNTTNSSNQQNELADNLSALLSNPTTPDGLREAIEEYIVNLSSETSISIVTPEVLKVALPLMLSKESEEKQAA